MHEIYQLQDEFEYWWGILAVSCQVMSKCFKKYTFFFSPVIKNETNTRGQINKHFCPEFIFLNQQL